MTVFLCATGRGGVGKTQLAVQLLAALKVVREETPVETLPIETLSLTFTCGSVGDFYKSLKRNNDDFNLGLNLSVAEPPHISTVKKAFGRMVDRLRCEENASRFKFMYFDDAEPKGSDSEYGHVLECIEELIIKKVKKSGGGNELQAKWKIVVTTTKTPEEWLGLCKYLDVTRENFFEVKEFDLCQTREYLQSLKLDAATSESLHDTVGGLQYALSVLRKTCNDCGSVRLIFHRLVNII